MNRPVGALLTLFLAGASVVFADPSRADVKEVVIGSGGKTGVYYPVAIALCRMFNEHRPDQTYHCSVESTGGSVDNLRRLRAGSIDFAIAQSDWQFHAYNGNGVFEKAGPHARLRSVFALYPEAFTVLARANTPIERFEDLRGSRVNIGNQGSGQRATMEVVMRAHEWTRFDFSLVREFSSQHQAQALCDNEVDAIVFVAGHPSGTIKSATAQCRSRLLDVSGPVIDKLIENNEYYRRAVIPADMYVGQDRPVTTFGVGATLVTDSFSSDSLVDTLVRSVFENLQEFKEMHPALSNLDADEMMKDGLSAPLHSAVRTYFETAGR